MASDAYWKRLKKQKQLQRKAARRAAKRKRWEANPKNKRKDFNRNYTEMSYREYLRTQHWARKRRRVLHRDEYACTNCHAHQNDPDVKLHVHHKTYKRFGCEELRDLITLCEDCHHALHDGGCRELAEHLDILHWRNGEKSAVRKVAV